MADREGIQFFNVHIPSAEEAEKEFKRTGIRSFRLPTPMEEELGTSDPTVITGPDLDLGGAAEKIRRLGGPAIEYIYDIGF